MIGVGLVRAGVTDWITATATLLVGGLPSETSQFFRRHPRHGLAAPAVGSSHGLPPCGLLSNSLQPRRQPTLLPLYCKVSSLKVWIIGKLKELRLRSVNAFVFAHSTYLVPEHLEVPKPAIRKQALRKSIEKQGIHIYG